MFQPTVLSVCICACHNSIVHVAIFGCLKVKGKQKAPKEGVLQGKRKFCSAIIWDNIVYEETTVMKGPLDNVKFLLKFRCSSEKL